VRNLVEIYGENWKCHYDLSWREKNVLSSNSISEHQFVGNAPGITLSKRMRSNRKIFHKGNHTNRINNLSASDTIMKTLEVLRDYSQVGSDSVETSLVSCIPYLSEPMGELDINCEVKSYIDLYNAVPRDLKRDTNYAFYDHSFQHSRITTWSTQAESVTESNVSSTSNRKERFEDVQDDWKNFDPNDIDNYWKMEGKLSESDKENVDPCQQYSPKPLFAVSNYGEDATGRLFGIKPRN